MAIHNIAQDSLRKHVYPKPDVFCYIIQQMLSIAGVFAYRGGMQVGIQEGSPLSLDRRRLPGIA